MDVYVLLRTNVNWLNFKQKNYLFGLEKIINKWNTTFEMPHQVFRHKIQQIAQENLNKVKKIRFINLNQISEISKHSLVIPIDDDDFLCPTIVEQLLTIDITQYYGVRWLSRKISNLNSTQVIGQCATNNYAINTYFTHLDWTISNLILKPCLLDHCVANEIFIYNYDANGVARLPIYDLPETLSVINKNIGSTTTIFECNNFSELYKQYLKAIDMELSDTFDWFKPCLLKLKDIYLELGKSRFSNKPPLSIL